MSHSCEAHQAGFTLIEAMAAVAVTAAIVAGIASITGQWLPQWHRGVVDLQRADLLSLGVERIAADIAAAEYVPATGDDQAPLFDGGPSSITFVRSSIEPDAPSRLEIVRIAETNDDQGFAIVRASAPFTPTGAGGALTTFANAIVLVRAPFSISFAYAGPDRAWMEHWRGNTRLPDAVRIAVREGPGGRMLAASTAVALRVTAPARDRTKIVPEAPLSAPETSPIAAGRP